jgi:hypothetical protein
MTNKAHECDYYIDFTKSFTILFSKWNGKASLVQAVAEIIFISISTQIAQ